MYIAWLHPSPHFSVSLCACSLPMNQSLVARQPIGSAHCAPSAHWRSRTSRRPLLSRHVINKQPVIGNTRLRKGSTGICCQQTAVSELEDVDPVTGEIVSGVKSKFPKYASPHWCLAPQDTWIVIRETTKQRAAQNDMHVTGRL